MFGVILLIMALWNGFQFYRARNYNRNIFPGLYDRWRRMYLCNKCGTSFELEENRAPMIEEAAVAIDTQDV